MLNDRPCEGKLTYADRSSAQVEYPKKCDDLFSGYKPTPKKPSPQKDLRKRQTSKSPESTSLSAGESGSNSKQQRKRTGTLTDVNKHWQANDADKHVQLFDVAKSSAEYKEVHDICGFDFVTRYEIRRLQRIQNPALWAGYRAYRESKKEPNEIWAVHGSLLDSLDNISANGFNRSYNGKNATSYGKGAYFAKTGICTYSCSSRYAAPNADGTQSMILASVVQGKSTLGTPDMVEPPCIDAATKLRYDTTTDSNGTIIVTYKDHQAYPAYLITFKSVDQQQVCVCVCVCVCV
jgi:poly [ADP-ribose] polymerase 10/14/15